MHNKIKTLILAFLFANTGIHAQEQTDDKIELSVAQAREYAIQNNYRMKNARQDVLAADKKVWETTAIGLPQVNGKIDYNNNIELASIPFGKDSLGNNIFFQMGAAHKASGALTVTQLVFDGSYIVGLQSAQTYRKISELAEKKSETLVYEAVTNAYGGVILSDETVKILKNNVEALEKNLNQIDALYKNGLAEEQSVEQIKILLSSTQNLLFNAEKDLETNLKMLKFTLGIDINQDITLTDSLDYILLENIDNSIVSKNIELEDNIDIQMQNNQVRSQELLNKLEKSKFLPSINAFYNAQKDAYADEFTFFDSDQLWIQSQMVGVSMNIPIFSSFMRHSKVQQSKIELEKAKITKYETEQQLLLNFERAKNVYVSAVNQYYTAKENMELSTKIRDKEEIKFFEGMSSSIDLSNAEVQMVNTQKAYIQSIYALIQSKAALDKMLVKFENE